MIKLVYAMFRKSFGTIFITIIIVCIFLMGIAVAIGKFDSAIEAVGYAFQAFMTFALVAVIFMMYDAVADIRAAMIEIAKQTKKDSGIDTEGK